MALASTVSGAGRVMSGGKETGSYSYNVTTIDEGGGLLGADLTKTYEVTVYYIDERTETKWVGLTLAACTKYITENPTAIANYSITNEHTQSYQLVVSTFTRTITGSTTTLLSEPPS